MEQTLGRKHLPAKHLGCWAEPRADLPDWGLSLQPHPHHQVGVVSLRWWQCQQRGRMWRHRKEVVMGRALLHLMRQGRCLEELFCLQEISGGGCVLSGGFCHLTLGPSRSF